MPPRHLASSTDSNPSGTMIVDVQDVRKQHGRGTARAAAMLEVLGVPDSTPDMAADAVDLLDDVGEMLDSGDWYLVVQVDEPRLRRLRSVELAKSSSGGVDVRRSSEYASHLGDSLETPVVCTLVYRAHSKPMPEETDVAHPAWEVDEAYPRATEVRFDLEYVGGES